MNADARSMTRDQIDEVLDRVRTWPLARQEDAARTLLILEATGTGIYHLSEDEERDLDEAEREIARGEVASDKEVAEVLAGFRIA